MSALPRNHQQQAVPSSSRKVPRVTRKRASEPAYGAALKAWHPYQTEKEKIRSGRSE